MKYQVSNIEQETMGEAQTRTFSMIFIRTQKMYSRLLEKRTSRDYKIT